MMLDSSITETLSDGGRFFFRTTVLERGIRVGSYTSVSSPKLVRQPRHLLVPARSEKRVAPRHFLVNMTNLR